MPASVPVLTFVSYRGGFFCEGQNQRDTGKMLDSSVVLDLTFASRTRGDAEANVKSTTRGEDSHVAAGLGRCGLR
jgi:hypothetical protein